MQIHDQLHSHNPIPTEASTLAIYREFCSTDCCSHFCAYKLDELVDMKEDDGPFYLETWCCRPYITHGSEI